MFNNLLRKLSGLFTGWFSPTVEARPVERAADEPCREMTPRARQARLRVGAF
jgi:hypothetical protein